MIDRLRYAWNVDVKFTFSVNWVYCCSQAHGRHRAEPRTQHQTWPRPWKPEAKLVVIAVVAYHFPNAWLGGCEKAAQQLQTACAALVYGHQFACVLEHVARSKEDRCKASVSACCVKQGCVYAQRIIVYLPNWETSVFSDLLLRLTYIRL